MIVFRFRFLSTAFMLIAVANIFCSCISSQSKISPLPPVTEQMKTKAGYLKKILFPSCREFGVFITVNTIDLYEQKPKALSERLLLLGVTDVYFDFDIKLFEQPDFIKKLHKIVDELRKQKIRCSPVIIDELMYQPDQHGAGADAVGNIIGEVNSFNRWVSSRREFTGIAASVSPHCIASSNSRIKHGLIYSWSENTYGVNCENDMIMKQAFDILRDIKDAAEPLPLSIIIENYYHDRAVKGDLSMGNVNDFLQFGDKVILTSYAKYSNEIKELAVSELKDCKKADSIVLCLRTSRTIYGEDSESVSFTRKKWKQFISDLNTLVQNSSKFKSFRGIAFREYDGLELQWEKVEEVK